MPCLLPCTDCKLEINLVWLCSRNHLISHTLRRPGVLRRWSSLGFWFSACWLAALSPASAWHISKESVTKKSRPVTRPGAMWPWDTENLQNVETELIILYSCLQLLAEGEQGEASKKRAVGWLCASLSESHSTEQSWGSTGSSDSGDAYCGSTEPTNPGLPSLNLSLYSYKMGRFLLWCTGGRAEWPRGCSCAQAGGA